MENKQIEKIIKIGQRLMELNNFSSAICVYLALKSYPDLLTPTHMESINRIFSSILDNDEQNVLSNDNFSNWSRTLEFYRTGVLYQASRGCNDQPEALQCYRRV